MAQCLVNAEADQASVFASKVEFADLIGADNKRLVEIWNSLPGVKALTKFTSRKVATERIWKAIQGLGAATHHASAAQAAINPAATSAYYGLVVVKYLVEQTAPEVGIPRHRHSRTKLAIERLQWILASARHIGRGSKPIW